MFLIFSCRPKLSLLRWRHPSAEGGAQSPGAQLLHETAQLSALQRRVVEEREPAHSRRPGEHPQGLLYEESIHVRNETCVRELSVCNQNVKLYTHYRLVSYLEISLVPIIQV